MAYGDIPDCTELEKRVAELEMTLASCADLVNTRIRDIQPLHEGFSTAKNGIEALADMAVQSIQIASERDDLKTELKAHEDVQDEVLAIVKLCKAKCDSAEAAMESIYELPHSPETHEVLDDYFAITKDG